MSASGEDINKNHKRSNETHDNGLRRVVCSCDWKSEWKDFLGQASLEYYQHLDEIIDKKD